MDGIAIQPELVHRADIEKPRCHSGWQRSQGTGNAWSAAPWLIRTNRVSEQDGHPPAGAPFSILDTRGAMTVTAQTTYFRGGGFRMTWRRVAVLLLSVSGAVMAAAFHSDVIDAALADAGR